VQPQRSPLKSEPLFLIWEREKPLAPKDFKVTFDFLLYDRIRQRQKDDEPKYTLEATLVYKNELGYAVLDDIGQQFPVRNLRGT